MKSSGRSSTTYHRASDGYGMPAADSGTTTTPRPFASPREPLALAPEAIGGLFPQVGPLEASMRDSIVVVEIRGPLMQHDDYWYDNYEAIKSRVTTALELKPAAVVLSIASPGGLVAGCFETADALRELAEIADVPMHAYVDGQATSAAYALACACKSITAPPSAMVGSIGVVAGLVDATANDAAWGLKFKIIGSGQRKTDGNPHVAMTDDAVAALEKRIADLAAIFFDHVATSRPGLTAEKVRALEAAILTGAQAQQVGLVDHVATLDGLLKALTNDPIAGLSASAETSANPRTHQGQTHMKTLLRALGLPDAASEAEALTALQTRDAAHQRLVQVSGKTNPAEAEAVFNAWKIGAEKSAAIEAELAATKKATVDVEAKALIDKATTEGRLPPASRAAIESMYSAHGIDAVKLSLSMLPAGVHVNQDAPKGLTENSEKPAGGLTAEDKVIAKMLGLTDEQALANKKHASNGGAA